MDNALTNQSTGRNSEAEPSTTVNVTGIASVGSVVVFEPLTLMAPE